MFLHRLGNRRREGKGRGSQGGSLGGPSWGPSVSTCPQDPLLGDPAFQLPERPSPSGAPHQPKIGSSGSGAWEGHRHPATPFTRLSCRELDGSRPLLGEDSRDSMGPWPRGAEGQCSQDVKGVSLGARVHPTPRTGVRAWAPGSSLCAGLVQLHGAWGEGRRGETGAPGPGGASLRPPPFVALPGSAWPWGPGRVPTEPVLCSALGSSKDLCTPGRGCGGRPHRPVFLFVPSTPEPSVLGTPLCPLGFQPSTSFPNCWVWGRWGPWAWADWQTCGCDQA